MLAFFVFAISVLLSISSATLNPLECNGIAFKVYGQAYAYPADECFGDQVTYTNGSFQYYCNAGTMYRAFWGNNNDCNGVPHEDITMSTWLTNQKAGNPFFGTVEGEDWIQECSLSACEVAKVRTWKPTSNTVFNSNASCQSYVIADHQSVHQDDIYIRNYCYNHTEATIFYGYRYSSQWLCTAVGNGAIAHYYWLNDDCSGQSEGYIFLSQTGITCNRYNTGNTQIFPDGYEWKKQEVTCDVATPPPTPAWTQPVTELPCMCILHSPTPKTQMYVHTHNM